MASKSEFRFDSMTLDVSPTGSTPTLTQRGAKFMERISQTVFLGKLGVTSIRRANPETVAIYADEMRIIIHPNGDFHMSDSDAPLQKILVFERYTKHIATLARDVLRRQRFEVSFQLHHEFGETGIRGAVARILSKVEASLMFSEIRNRVEPKYVLLEIDPQTEIGLGEDGHVDLYYEPKPIAVGDMKEKYILGHVGYTLSTVLRELG